MIEVERLHKEYEGVEVVEDLSFSLEEGGSMTIIGPSGCGKTTLLYILAGLTKPTSGTVTIDGKTVNGPSMSTAFILQDYGLLPWKTVKENICLGMRIRRMAEDEMEQRSEDLLQEMGLEHHRDDFPSKLSGGERQRVAIGRSLALDPKLLLMDEPFSSLDTLTRERMQDLILGIRSKKRLTMITVTHSIEEAAYLGRTILVLGGRPCSIHSLVQNPEVGKSDYRNTEEYFSTCKQVRRMVTEP